VSLENDFFSMTADSVTVHQPTTANAYGATTPATSAGVSYPAHIDMTPRQVLSVTGVEQVSNGTIYVLSSSATIPLDAVVELSDGRTPELLRVEPLRDDEGQHHIEVSFR
jgi:hypothetical protein